ncbi:hypothetical protein [Actinomadura sp. 9N215]
MPSRAWILDLPTRGRVALGGQGTSGTWPSPVGGGTRITAVSTDWWT